MAESQPRLLGRTRASADAVVLVLHGGRDHSGDPVRPNQLAVLRMLPFGHAIVRAGGGRLAVHRLLYAVRGWNEPTRSPMRDARWALRQLTDRYPGRPIGLVGHS